jgi:hypothetical protein
VDLVVKYPKLSKYKNVREIVTNAWDWFLPNEDLESIGWHYEKPAHRLARVTAMDWLPLANDDLQTVSAKLDLIRSTVRLAYNSLLDAYTKAGYNVGTWVTIQ